MPCAGWASILKSIGISSIYYTLFIFRKQLHNLTYTLYYFWQSLTNVSSSFKHFFLHRSAKTCSQSRNSKCFTGLATPMESRESSLRNITNGVSKGLMWVKSQWKGFTRWRAAVGLLLKNREEQLIGSVEDWRSRRIFYHRLVVESLERVEPFSCECFI